MLNFCDFIQVYVFSTNHHLSKTHEKVTAIWVGWLVGFGLTAF